MGHVRSIGRRESGKYYFGDPEIDGRIILNWISKKQNVILWIRFSCFRVQFPDLLLWKK
jgi:hypothetical protein